VKTPTHLVLPRLSAAVSSAKRFNASAAFVLPHAGGRANSLEAPYQSSRAAGSLEHLDAALSVTANSRYAAIPIPYCGYDENQR
jgi:hypothetical protein